MSLARSETRRGAFSSTWWRTNTEAGSSWLPPALDLICRPTARRASKSRSPVVAAAGTVEVRIATTLPPMFASCTHQLPRRKGDGLRAGGHAEEAADLADVPAYLGDQLVDAGEGLLATEAVLEGDRHVAPVQVAVEVEQDRKSTRLNSSHVRISYAVFCLKKKKK